jgi:hydrogenase/urease accessory protein HupE
MKHGLGLLLSFAPALVLAHSAPFGHAHGLLDGAHPALGILLLVAIGVGLWASWRRR